MSRCVLLCAGPVKKIGSLRRLLRPDDVFIAADGGSRLAKRLGVRPYTTVADFDSSAPLRRGDSVCLPVRKDVTDAAAAAAYGCELGFRDFLILGGTGGRLDHQYANQLLLYDLARQGCRAAMADEENYMEVMTESPVSVPPMVGWSLSLFAFIDPVFDLTIKGADYPLTGYDLSPGDPLCVSNAAEHDGCTITFSSGTLLLFRSKC